MFIYNIILFCHHNFDSTEFKIQPKCYDKEFTIQPQTNLPNHLYWPMYSPPLHNSFEAKYFSD
jgi:hypothetical protein